MKKIVAALAFVLCMAASMNSNAQAWGRDSKVLSLGVGGATMAHFDPGNYYRPGRYYWTPVTGQLLFQGEFAVHQYVGLGFTTGIGGGGAWRYYYPEFNVPLGMIVNFHFYQLIADKSSRDIKSDKLDIYAGLNIGSGVAAVFDRPAGYTRIHPLFFAGPQVGLRYYFVPKVALNAELGYGKSWANIGFSFKL